MERGKAAFTVHILCIRCAKRFDKPAHIDVEGKIEVEGWRGPRGFLCDHCGVNGLGASE